MPPSSQEPSDDPQTDEPAQADTEQPEYVSPEEVQASASGEYEEVGGMLIDTGTGKDKYQTDPVPEGKPIPVEPEDVEISDAAYTCTLSISCATILDNLDLCDPEKVELVPADGWILQPMTVTFYEGESVFNVLQRTCKQQKIHMEFSNTPIYNSTYIEVELVILRLHVRHYERLSVHLLRSGAVATRTDVSTFIAWEVFELVVVFVCREVCRVEIET